MKVDTHVHLFSEHLGFAMCKNAQIEYDKDIFLSLENTLGATQGLGAQMVVLRGWPFNTFDLCQEQNRLIEEAMHKNPQTVKGFCTVCAEKKDAALQEVSRCFEAGFIGLGELDPLRQNFTLQDPWFLQLCDLCEQAEKPLNLYTRFPVCEADADNGVLLAQDLLQLIENRPQLCLVLSHYGAGLPFYALMPEVHKLLQNVWFDTAPDDCLFSENAQAAAACCLGRERLLYGSNTPFMQNFNDVCPTLPKHWEKWI